MNAITNSAMTSLVLICTSIGAVSTAAAQAPQPVKPPAVQAPSVAAPKAPTVAAPTGSTATAAVSGSNVARAALVTTAYDEAAYTAATTAGAPIVLVFGSSTDPIWATQAAALQVILREPEFSRGPNFQIDMANAEIAEKFAVRSAGTILIMKDGMERMRSTRMSKPDVIRKMLRLKTTL